MFGKILTDEQRKALVWDVERGSPNSIYEEPWQTCSCLGGWHYDTRLAENGWYKSASDVVKLLVDVVRRTVICCLVFLFGLTELSMKRKKPF